jgi:hypothetical protein
VNISLHSALTNHAEYQKGYDGRKKARAEISDLQSEIRCLKIQTRDRGNSFQSATEENKRLRATLKEVSGCFENHGGPKLCEGCLISIGDALAE